MIPESERGWARLVRRDARGRMRYLLREGTILCMPTTPFPAPSEGNRSRRRRSNATACCACAVTAD